MATHNPRSGGTNNNIGSILNAGTPAKSTFNSLSLSTNSTTHHSPRGVHSATQNIGTTVPYSGAEYSFDYRPTADQWIGSIVGTSIAGQVNNTLRSGASGPTDVQHENNGYERLSISAWDYVTGSPTKTGSDGTTILSSGVDGTVGDPDTQAFGRGNITFNQTGKTPSNLAY